MLFFEQQERARKKSFWLWMLFVCAVLLVTAGAGVALWGIDVWLAKNWNVSMRDMGFEFSSAQPRGLTAGLGLVFPIWAYGAAFGSAFFSVAGFGVFHWINLKSGGGALIAQMAGGDELERSARLAPDEKRFANVVEEMSIASGVPMPRIFVLPEDSINAFAAGYETDDAAVAVTRGALRRLSRDELQGVIGHEFSHILNGDMRLNVKALSMILGLAGMSLVGRELMGAARGVSGSSEDRRVGVAFLALGSALLILGLMGVLMGRIIAAAISREREYLADASAIQFTRNQEGIGGALRKLKWLSGEGLGSALDSQKGKEISYMCFAGSSGSWFSFLVSTHPPLDERIQRIYGRPMAPIPAPEMKEDAPDWGALAPGASRQEEKEGRELAQSSGFAALGASRSAPMMSRKMEEGLGAGAKKALLIASGAQETVSEPEEVIPERLRMFARAKSSDLALALMMTESAKEERPGALEKCCAKRSGEQKRSALALAEELSGEPQRRWRVALAQLSAPELRKLPAPAKEALIADLDALAQADGQMSLFETALSFALARSMREGAAGSLRSGKFEAEPEIYLPLASGIAFASGAPKASREAMALAFAKTSGVAKSKALLCAQEAPSQKTLFDALSRARALAPMQKPLLAKALTQALSEAPMEAKSKAAAFMETLCWCMACPMPPAALRELSGR